ncbi:MAG: protein kinase [Rhodocyclaceae bacterium]|jgi:serine/threonine protein kinase|nr:Serine/threonine-protein kinase PknD [Rhodocyclaceae bacterium]MBZ0144718.1 protein kinase [Rhodocyclaceae bacterium]MCC6879393.1 protein kinase [Rhodocyclaceae bacterium]MCL4682924.1 protein kinase [Rhodocyclaceae bacterium]
MEAETPERIGKYEVRGRLGEGATSTVWQAWDPFAQREVAIKVINPEVLRDRDRGRIYRHLLVNEASLAGKLVHPHIVQIFDAVVDEAQSYIVMEYVPGGTLEPFCSPDNLLPLDRLVEIVFKCTRALDYAYHLGITHRDIKPANILLAVAGDIKISDFGAALFTSGEQTRTQVSGVGSPAYMSPQQVREMPLNHQTDIYSLGVVMYQLLTGRLPFQASNNFSMVYQITHVDPPPPSDFRRDIPAGLDAVVARAMQKDLSARYVSWEEFSHDLAQAFRNKQLKARERDFADTEKYETLRGLPFFAEFSDVEIWEIVRFSDWDQVAPETVIMKDGEPGDYFCFLAEGEVKIAKRGRILGILTPGDCFGEMAVISQSSGSRNADVVAQTPAKIITIRGDALRQASEVCRMHFYAAFLEVLANRLALANARLASV